MMHHILSFIPHRPPFIMVDDVLASDGRTIQTVFTIPQQNPLINNGFFTEGGLLENMAQSAAAGTGYVAIRNGMGCPSGYIAALKNIHIQQLPRINDIIHTQIILLKEVMNARIARATITMQGKEIASCELQIFIKPTEVRL
jgi:3-hydroxyacyl-[acyl-carrier-protein] dehydratase